MPNRLFLTLVAGLSSLGVLAFFLTGFLSQAAADDYCFGEITYQRGLLGAQLFWYNEWTGRFFSSALLTINPLIWAGPRLYFLQIVLLMASFVASCFLLVRSVLPKVTKLELLAFGSLLSFTILSFNPLANELLYWVAGSTTYLLPTAMAFVLISLMASHYRTPRSWKLVLSVLLTFTIAGSNETIMLVQLGLLAIASFGYLLLYRKLEPSLTALFISSIVGAAIVMIAPGNTVRSSIVATYSQPLGLGSAIYMATIKGFEYFISNLRSTPLILISALAMLAPVQLTKPRWLKPHLILTTTLAAIWGCFFVSFWSIGAMPPERTMLVPFVCLILGGILFGFSLGTKPHSYALLMGGILLLGFLSPNFASLTDGWRTRDILAYRRENLAQQSQIADCVTKGLVDCVVDPITQNPPIISRNGGLTKNPDDWVNKCASGYYKLNSITVR